MPFWTLLEHRAIEPHATLHHVQDLSEDPSLTQVNPEQQSVGKISENSAGAFVAFKYWDTWYYCESWF